VNDAAWKCASCTIADMVIHGSHCGDLRASDRKRAYEDVARARAAGNWASSLSRATSRRPVSEIGAEEKKRLKSSHDFAERMANEANFYRDQELAWFGNMKAWLESYGRWNVRTNRPLHPDEHMSAPIIRDDMQRQHGRSNVSLLKALGKRDWENYSLITRFEHKGKTKTTEAQEFARAPWNHNGLGLSFTAAKVMIKFKTTGGDEPRGDAWFYEDTTLMGWGATTPPAHLRRWTMMAKEDFNEAEKKEIEEGNRLWTITVGYVPFRSKDHAHTWASKWRAGTDCQLHLAGLECSCDRMVSEHRHQLYCSMHPSYPAA